MFSAVNNELLDTYQLKSLDGLFEGDIRHHAIVKDNVTGRLKLADEEGEVFDGDNFGVRDSYDRVLRCLGWTFDDAVFNRCVWH